MTFLANQWQKKNKKKTRKLAEVLSEDEKEDSLRKVKKNAKKRNTDNPPVKITNLLSSPTSQNG